MSGTLGPREEVRRGVRESIPLGFALVPVGLAFGYGAHVVGLSWWLAGLMSTFVYGGPSSLAAFLRDAPRAKLLSLAQGLADGSYGLSLAHAREHPDQPRKERFLQGSFYVSFGAWVSSSIAGALASPKWPKSTCRHGLSLSMEPQNDFFLMPTSVNVVVAGNFVPDISTEAALCHVYLESPVHSKLHRPPFGSSLRAASHSAGDMVILTVITLSSA